VDVLGLTDQVEVTVQLELHTAAQAAEGRVKSETTISISGFTSNTDTQWADYLEKGVCP
jgi:hypothetical protein